MRSRAITTARPLAPPRPPSCTTQTSSTHRRRPGPSATTSNTRWPRCWRSPARFSGASATSSAVSQHGASPSSPCVAISQAVGLAGVALWVWLANDPFPGVSELLPGAAAGVASVIGLGALYRGLAVGAMGIVAPISAASPVVPLAVDVARGVTPGALQWLGIALVLAGIVTLSYEPSGGGGGRVAAGAGLAVVAALGFGSFIVGIDAAADESAPWAVVAARSSSVILALVIILLTSDVAPRVAPALAGARRGRSLRHRRQRRRRLRNDRRGRLGSSPSSALCIPS